METLSEAQVRLPRKLNPLSVRELLSVGTLLQKKPLETFTFIHQTYGDIVYCPWAGAETLFLYHPDHIRHVLKDNHTNYQKSWEYKHLKPLLGDGLLTSEGELWREQRKIMARQFHAPAIEQYLPSIQGRIEASLEELKARPLNRSLDMTEFYSAVTFEIAGEIFFGARVDEFSGVVREALHKETARVNKRMRSLINLPMFVPTKENLEGKASIKSLDQIVEKIIDEDHSGKNPNVLTKLLGHDPTMPKKQIRDEVMTLLLAGHETTSNTLTWTTWYLGQHPEWQELLAKELGVLGKKARDLTRAELLSLRTFRSVIKEALRLMPPVPAMSRMAVEDDVIDGFIVPKGLSVVMQPWVTHRDPRFWKDALSFSPERFFEREERRDDCSFFPFAKGPRACIGEDLAMIEGTAILAQLVEAFSWRLSPGFMPVPVHNLTLRSENGMWLKLFPR